MVENDFLNFIFFKSNVRSLTTPPYTESENVSIKLKTMTMTTTTGCVMAQPYVATVNSLSVEISNLFKVRKPFSTPLEKIEKYI